MQFLHAPSGKNARRSEASTGAQTAEQPIDPTLELRTVATIAFSCASSWEGVLAAGEMMALETVNPYVAVGTAFGAGLGMTGCIVMSVSKAFMPANSEAYKAIDDVSGVFSNAPGFILGAAGSMVFGEVGLKSGAQLGTVLQDLNEFREAGEKLGEDGLGLKKNTFEFFMKEQSLEEDSEKLFKTLSGISPDESSSDGSSYYWNSVTDSMQSYDGSLQLNGPDGGAYVQPSYDDTSYIPPPVITAPSGDPPSTGGGGFEGGFGDDDDGCDD